MGKEIIVTVTPQGVCTGMHGCECWFCRHFVRAEDVGHGWKKIIFDADAMKDLPKLQAPRD